MKATNFLSRVNRCALILSGVFAYGNAYAIFNITSVEPSTGRPGETLQVNIHGTDFEHESEFKFSGSVSLYSLRVQTDGMATARIVIGSNARGSIDLTGWSTGKGGGDTREVTLKNAFTVTSGSGKSAGAAGLSDTGLQKSGAALVEGNVWVWGQRSSGLQGNGVEWVDEDAAPAKVESLHNILQLAGGAGHLIALDENGDVYGWGQNRYGETGCLGDYVATPCKVMTDAVQLAAETHSSMALDKHGQVWTWGVATGSQFNGNEGQNGSVPEVTPLQGEKTRLIGRSDAGAFAISDEGHVWVWGSNEAGALGLEAVRGEGQQLIRTPVRATFLEPYAEDIAYIGGGTDWSEALLTDGRVIGWGRHAALGVGTTDTNVSRPEPVVIMENVARLFVRSSGSMALTQEGTVYTWGELGDAAFPVERNVSDFVDALPVEIGGTQEAFYYLTEAGKLYRLNGSAPDQSSEREAKAAAVPSEIPLREQD